MNIVRLIMLVVCIPVYFIIGGLIGWPIQHLSGIWDHYILAFTLPLSGILGAWFIAPYEKAYAAIGIYLIGLFLAYSFAFPSFYPENHELAYQQTYMPFIICVVWGFLLASGVWAYENKQQTKS